MVVAAVLHSVWPLGTAGGMRRLPRVAMSVKRVEAELTAVESRLAALRQEIASPERWEGDLRTSLHVLTRLAGNDPDSQAVSADVHTVVREKRVNDATGEVRQRTVHHGRPLATGKALEPGEALVAMLRAGGKHIRPMDAVSRLRDEHGIQIGLGKPGRETSDLSAAIGHGRIPGLVVTRSQG
jgi:hypothetical protein